MRYRSAGLLAAAALSVSGCVIATPVAGPVPVTRPPVVMAPAPVPVPAPVPTALDAAGRTIARTVVSAEMQKRLPGVNVAPYTDCIIANATTAELIDLVQMSRAGVAGTADSVAVIVKRPTTAQCIAAAARTA